MIKKGKLFKIDDNMEFQGELLLALKDIDVDDFIKREEFSTYYLLETELVCKGYAKRVEPNIKINLRKVRTDAGTKLELIGYIDEELKL